MRIGGGLPTITDEDCGSDDDARVAAAAAELILNVFGAYYIALAHSYHFPFTRQKKSYSLKTGRPWSSL